MEAIKFSELPSGDRMPLADEDGVPIIASQENRLLTWGRLKKQLAEQTHTDEVKPNDTKVPTSSAVENRIVATEDDLQTKLAPLETKLGEHDTAIENATTTASEAKTTAESAQTAAEGAANLATTAKTTAENVATQLSDLESAKANKIINCQKLIISYTTDENTGEITSFSKSLSPASNYTIAELIEQITANQVALYGMFEDVYNRAAANSTNTTALIDNMTNLLNQVVN